MTRPNNRMLAMSPDVIPMPTDLGNTPHLLRLAQTVDTAIAETNEINQRPEVLAHSAADAARRHDTVTIEDVRAAIEESRTEGDLLTAKAEEFIEAQQERGARLIDELRAHTSRMAALREHINDATALLKNTKAD